MTVFGAVFARGGSKGVPGKNLRKIGGASLLELAVTVGLGSDVIDRMICSTDSREIADEATRAGAEVPFIRPGKLAADDAPEWLAWQHFAHFLIKEGASEGDILISLPATSPLRSVEDIVKALALFQSGGFDLVLGVSESTRSPWFNMVSRAESSEVSPLNVGGSATIYRRQDAAPVFDITTVVYVTTLGFVLDAQAMFDGRVGSVLVPRERAVDIDTELDLQIADFLAQKQLDLPGD